MTVDVDKEAGYLYIHWIKVRGRDVETATRQIGGRFEPILMKIFEEDVV
jgi:multisubunit Na+/H+ antiporter MnhE subunit